MFNADKQLSGILSQNSQLADIIKIGIIFSVSMHWSRRTCPDLIKYDITDNFVFIYNPEWISVNIVIFKLT